MPLTRAEIIAFDKKVRLLQKQAVGLSDATVIAVEEVVQKYQGIIGNLIRNASNTEQIEAYALPRLSRQIQEQVNLMLNETTKIINDAQAGVFRTGISQGQATAQAIGIEPFFISPTPELLSLATNYTADYVKSIATKYMPKVNSVLQRAVLGGQSPFEAMKNIDKIIGNKGQQGVSYQAERIVRTEVNRVYSIATDATVQEFAKQVKGLKKQWVSGAFREGRRVWHQSENVNGGEPIPFDKPFEVGGEPLQFPRDPNGSPENTINCGCQMILVVDDAEER